MADWIPQAQLPYGMAEQLIRLKSQSGDAWAALAQHLGQTVGGALQNRAEQQQKTLTPEQLDAIRSYTTQPSGRQIPGQNGDPGITIGQSANQPLDKSMFPRGIPAPGMQLIEQANKNKESEALSNMTTSRLLGVQGLKGEQAATKDHTPATTEMLKNYPAVQKMGFQEGDLVPNRFIVDPQKLSVQTGEKQAQFETRRWDKLKEHMDAARAARGGVIGQAMKNNMNARRAALTANDPNAIPQQIDAGFADYASIMKNGAAPDQETMRHLNIDTMAKRWANLKQLITSTPQAVNTPEVQAKLKSMLNDVIAVDNKAQSGWWDFNEKANKDILKHPERRAMWDEMRKSSMEMTNESSSASGGDKSKDPMGLF